MMENGKDSGGINRIMKKTILLYFYLLQLFAGSRRAAYKKAEYLHSHDIFNKFGGGGYWHPRTLPSFPKNISIGENVTVCADVKFYEHELFIECGMGIQLIKGRFCHNMKERL